MAEFIFVRIRCQLPKDGFSAAATGVPPPPLFENLFLLNSFYMLIVSNKRKNACTCFRGLPPGPQQGFALDPLGASRQPPNLLPLNATPPPLEIPGSTTAFCLSLHFAHRE